MKIIIATDIFGKTPALEQLAATISENAVILEPYNGRHMDFDSEGEVYTYFTENVGLGCYGELVEEYVSSCSEKLLLIGFSIGASAIWNLSENRDLSNISEAICFYGSQIRNRTDVTPTFPIQMVFPKAERHFSVRQLIDQIENKKNVSVRQVPYFHGFMNEKSENFNLNGYEQGMEILAKKICEQRSKAVKGSSKVT